MEINYGMQCAKLSLDSFHAQKGQGAYKQQLSKSVWEVHYREIASKFWRDMKTEAMLILENHKAII